MADETVTVQSLGNSISSSRHSLTCFFHLAFKIAAIVSYIIGGIIWDSSVQIVIVMLLNAVDFYFVKNISGRYLVGLRWWTMQNADGITQSFRFEKTNHPERVSKTDSRIFWTMLLVSTGCWCLFSITTLLGLRLKWLVVASLGAFLSGYNLYAFMQAARDSKTVMSMFSFIPKTFKQKAVETLGNAAMNVAKQTLVTPQTVCRVSSKQLIW